MREGNPDVGDRVRVKETGNVGTVEYLENHQFDAEPTRVGVRFDAYMDTGGEFSVSEIEPINLETNCRRCGIVLVDGRNPYAKEKRRATNGI